MDEAQETTADEQRAIVEEFLRGLLGAFGLDAEVRTELVDDVVEASISGSDLGILIGPGGTTLHALQELAATVLQRRVERGSRARITVDVGGYRERRRAALAQFTTELAEEVQASGVARALEPMNAADRKVVHDTVNELDGVATISEGDDPRRRVVIVPAP